MVEEGDATRAARDDAVQDVPAWLRRTDGENRLAAAAATAAAIALQLLLPPRFRLQPGWVLPSVGLLLLISLTVLNPVRVTRATRLARRGSLLPRMHRWGSDVTPDLGAWGFLVAFR